MTHLDLFSGIGGWALAARWTWQHEHEILGFVERDKYCQKVLKKNFPGVSIIGEIKECDGTKFGSVELVTGSPPCQPFSVAGKRQGKEDDRHLWPEMFRILKEAKPRWACIENVAGIANMVLDEMLDDLESEGFEAQTYFIPACGVGANHRRERLWIVAHNSDGGNGHKRKIGEIQERQDSESTGVCSDVADTKHERLEERRRIVVVGEAHGIKRDRKEGNDNPGCKIKIDKGGNDVADTESEDNGGHHSRTSKRQIQQPRISDGKANVSHTNRATGKEQGIGFATPEKFLAIGCGGWWEVEPAVGRVVDGLPHRVDRLRGLGNAIVPQVAWVILDAIRRVECEQA